jgi:hypothetical protein
MTIIAAGARYDKSNGLQCVVIITDENNGHTSHLEPHKLHAAKLGHMWVNIEPEVYNSFKNHDDLVEHIKSKVKS